MNRKLENFVPVRRLVSVARILVMVMLAGVGSAQEEALVAPGVAQMSAGDCLEGQRQFLAGDYEAAGQSLTSCLERFGDRLEPLVYLTIIAVIDGSPESGVDYGVRAVAVDSFSADARYWYGRALLLAGKRSEVRAQWKLGLLQATGHAGLLEGLARFALEDGQDAKAYGLLRQLQRQGVDDGWIHDLLSDLARRKGHWLQARQHLRDAIDRSGGTEERWFGIAELSLVAGDGPEALNSFRRLVDEYPSAMAHGGLGEALFAAGETDAALVNLKRAVELDGDVGRYHFNLANVLELVGRLEEAEQHFARYLELEPNDAMGHFNYSVHLRRQGRRAEALAEAELAASRAPDMIAAHVARGELLEALDRPAEALEVVEKLVAVLVANASLVVWRDELAGKLEREDAARHSGAYRLRHIVVDDPDIAEFISNELVESADFGALAVRFSLGKTAASGGEIGWVVPDDLQSRLRDVVADLEVGESSEPVHISNQYHFFMRFR